MTKAVSAITQESASDRAGAALGREIRAGLDGQAADAVIVFASARHDYERLLEALAEQCGTEVIVGASSAGEFTNEILGEGQVTALALRSDSMEFAVGIGRDVASDPAGAAVQVAGGFRGVSGTRLPHRAALVMADALAGHTDALVEALTVQTGGNYRFFGGGAGDDGRFEQTHVLAGTQAFDGAVVALEILSADPIGIGVAHGWEPASAGMRVTEVDGMRLVSLDGAPAVHAFEEHAEVTGQTFDPEDPLPFFLHNVLGIESPEGYRLRVPLGVNADGSVDCAAAVPQGAVVHVMRASARSAIEAAQKAAQSAREALMGREASCALVFDCVATRLRLGREFGDELKACADSLAPARYVGCNTYGQIARAEGQFGGFHNCTAVVCVLPG